MFEIRNLSVDIATKSGEKALLKDVSLSVKPGETYALVGESGSGKSMTALAALRLLPEGMKIRSGAVLTRGEDVFSLTEEEMCKVRGSKISLIFQEPATSLNPVVRAGDQILEALLLHKKVTKEIAKEKVLSTLRRVGFEDSIRIAKAYPHELSGGQKQRVMIAMALIAGPAVLIADEPTTALDVTLQAQILDLLDDLKREKSLSLLLITHDLALVKHYANRVGLMYAGEIVEEASVEDFFTSPLHPYAKGLLRAVPNAASRGRPLKGIAGVVPVAGETFSGCAFASRCKFSREDCKRGKIPLLAVGGNRLVRCLHRAGSSTEGDFGEGLSYHREKGEAVLRVENLTVDYETSGGFLKPQKYFRAIDNVSLELSKGETLALVGESGSGKSTLAKTLLRLLEGKIRASGHATLGGIDVLGAKGEALQKLRRFAQIVFQDPFSSFDPRMTIGECIAEGILSLGVSHAGENIENRIASMLQIVGLPRTSARRLPHEFSGGQRQRIALARALAVKPEVIICDEPTSALDVSVQAQILNLMREIQLKTGVSYLFITHNFAVVECVADRIAVMQKGRIVESGPAAEVLQRPKDPYTKKLLSSVPRL